jgi:large subunit ribosomal protein L6
MCLLFSSSFKTDTHIYIKHTKLKIQIMYTFIVNIPKNVDIDLKNGLYLKGPFGSKHMDLSMFENEAVGFTLQEKTDKSFDLLFKKSQKASDKKLVWIQTLFKNAIEGITLGFTLTLLIVGVGYRVTLEEVNNQQLLHFKVGQTHAIKHFVSNAKVFVPDPTTIHLLGVDKQKLAQEAAKIQAYKKPDVYKGKGIKLSNQILYLKEPKKK